MKYGLLTSLLVLVLDQASKYVMVFFVMAEKRFIEVTGFFNLVLVKNTGISFSLFAGAEGFGKYLLLAVVSLIILWLCLWMSREKDVVTKIALGAVIGGAVGNLIDRFTYGGVVDFLDFHLAGRHWPAFNVADSFICIGAIVIVVRGLKIMKKERHENG